jgi:hypothetical protein
VRQELDRARECEVQAVDGHENFHVRSVKLRDVIYSVAYDTTVDRLKCDLSTPPSTDLIVGQSGSVNDQDP